MPWWHCSISSAWSEMFHSRFSTAYVAASRRSRRCFWLLWVFQMLLKLFCYVGLVCHVAQPSAGLLLDISVVIIKEPASCTVRLGKQIFDIVVKSIFWSRIQDTPPPILVIFLLLATKLRLAGNGSLCPAVLYIRKLIVLVSKKSKFCFSSLPVYGSAVEELKTGLGNSAVDLSDCSLCTIYRFHIALISCLFNRIVQS